MKIKNITLTISIIGFAIGFSDLQDNMFFALGRPVGAVAFILFFILAVLEKEFALLDEQERVKALDLKTRQPLPTVSPSSSNKESCAPALTTATSP